MSEEGDGLPVVRVKFACANVEEFRRKFEPNLLAKGMLARTPQMYEVGKRVRLRLELQDGSLGVDEEAVVQALEWTGGKQAMRLQLLRARSPGMPAPAPQPVAAASTAGPQAVALPAPAPPQRVATGTAIPAVTDWGTKAPERARTDTETTRAMSLDELLNALPPTAKPKLTPSGGVPRLTPAGGVPHLNGASAKPSSPMAGGGFHPAPPAPPPPSAVPLAPPIASPPALPSAPVQTFAPSPAAPPPVPEQAYAPPAEEYSPPPPQDFSPPPEEEYSPPPQTHSPPPVMAVPAEVTTFPPATAAPPASALPPPISEGERPPPVRPMTPMYPMPAFTSAELPAPPPEPAPAASEPVPTQGSAGDIPMMSAAEFKASLTGEVTVGQTSSSTGELADSIHEAIQPEAEPGVDLAGPTAFNTATEATTASNATIAVPGLANEVKAARKRGPSFAIVTFILFLAALSGAGAYLWRTGQLEAYAPALASRLPPSPALVAKPTPAPTPAPTTTAPAEAAKPPPPAAAEAPKPPATAEAPPAATAEAPKPPAEEPKTVAAAEPPKPPPAEAPTPPAAAEGPQVKLIITTTPPGAKVLANGEQVGVSPMELPWALGKPIKLRFTMPGFKPANRSFTPNATGTLDVTLAPSAAQANELKDVY